MCKRELRALAEHACAIGPITVIPAHVRALPVIPVDDALNEEDDDAWIDDDLEELMRLHHRAEETRHA